MTGGSVSPGTSNYIGAFNANRRGAAGQLLNIIVEGGNIVSGGRNGAMGPMHSMPFQSMTSTQCLPSGNPFNQPFCMSQTVHIVNGTPGAGGAGEHCGSAPQMGGHGAPGSFQEVRSDTIGTMMLWDCQMQWVGTSMQQVCSMRQAYTVNSSRQWVHGLAGNSGQDGTSGAAGIRNPGNAVISIIDGGRVRGM